MKKQILNAMKQEKHNYENLSNDEYSNTEKPFNSKFTAKIIAIDIYQERVSKINRDGDEVMGRKADFSMGYVCEICNHKISNVYHVEVTNKETKETSIITLGKECLYYTDMSYNHITFQYKKRKYHVQ